MGLFIVANIWIVARSYALEGVVQDVTTSGREVDVPLRDALIKGIGKERYELWFDGKAAFSSCDQVLTCSAVNSFYRDWLRANFRRAIEVATVSVLGEGISVAFEVDAQLATVDQNRATADSSDAMEAGQTELPPVTSSPTASSPTASSPTVSLPSLAKRSADPKKRSADAGAGHQDRRAVAGRQRAYASIDDFVVGHANRVAQASVCMVTESPGCLTPLFLHGATGVGKTHLLESAWSGTLAQQPAARGLFLTAEQFTSLFLEALHHSGLPSFRRKYRNLELLILDDIQFFGGKKATLGELLHTIETMLRHGRQIVLAADRPATELQGFPAELISRFAGGMVCKMLPPDLKMRKEIVHRHVSQRQWNLDEEIQALVAGRMSESPRELFGALNRLRATELATGNPLTLSTAEESLADLFLYRGRTIHLKDIEQAVCDTFGLEAKSLRSTRKIKSIAQPRMLAMWLARKYTRRGLAEIGEYFGNRSHATVISAQKRVTSWVDHGDVVQLADHTCPIEDAIRRVESRMQA